MSISKYSHLKSGDSFNGFTLCGDIKKIHTHWGADFICKCGEIFTRTFSNLERNLKHGCLNCSNKARGSSLIKHDQAYKHLYKLWKGMNHRCHNEKNPHYSSYGGRGIFVCESWRDTDPIKGFKSFCEDVGDRPDGTSLDRINNEKGYFKENVRWATQKQQTNNTRVNRVVTYLGDSYTVAQIAEKFNLKHNTVEYRLLRGWSVEEAVGVVKRLPRLNNRVRESESSYLGTLTDEQLLKINAMNDGIASSARIANALGISKYVVYNYIRKFSVTRLVYDFFGDSIIVNKAFKLSQDDVEYFKKELTKGTSKEVLSKTLKVSVGTIYELCRRLRWDEFRKNSLGR